MAGIQGGIPLVTTGSLLIFAYLGTFSRFMSDDFFSATVLKTHGYWGTQIFYWKYWTGRYSFIALLSFVELFGLKVATILPSLFLFLLVFSISWAAYQLVCQYYNGRPILIRMTLASVVTWVAIRSMYQYSQVVFWLTGIINYTIAPIMLAVGIGMIIKRYRSNKKMNFLVFLAFTSYAFIAGGFSEISVAIQIAMLGGMILITLWKQGDDKKIMLLLLSPMVLGSALSLVVMSLAPGNYVRATLSEVAYAWMRELSLTTEMESGKIGSLLSFPGIVTGIYQSLIQTLLFFPKWLNERTTFAVWSFFVGSFLKFLYPAFGSKGNQRDIIHSFFENLFIVFLGVWSAFAISFISRGVSPPERALLLPYFLITYLAIYSGWIASSVVIDRLSNNFRILAQVIITLLAYTGLVYGPLITAIGSIKLLPAIKTYAELWDERDQHIRESAARGEQEITVTNFHKHPGLYELGDLTIWKEGELEEDPNYWTNQAVAWYYGVDEISTK